MRAETLSVERVRFLIRVAYWRGGRNGVKKIGAVFDFGGGECVTL